VSSTEIPMTTTSSGYALEIAIKWGISDTQGGHHVAQKLSTMTLPLKEAKSRVLPAPEIFNGAETTTISFVGRDCKLGNWKDLAAINTAKPITKTPTAAGNKNLEDRI